jgi:hypothetical protein
MKHKIMIIINIPILKVKKLVAILNVEYKTHI